MNSLGQMMSSSMRGGSTSSGGALPRNIGGSGASPRYREHDEVPVGRLNASAARRNPLDEVPVGRSGTSARPNPYDEVPIGRSGSSARPNPYDDVPVGRSGSSARPNPYDDVPVGRSGSSARRNPMDEVPVGRSGSSARTNPYDEVPVGRSGSSARTNPYDEVPVGGRKATGASPRYKEHDEMPVGGRSSGSAARRNPMDEISDGRAPSSYNKGRLDEAPLDRAGSSKAGAGPNDGKLPADRSPRSSLNSKNNFDEVPTGRKSAAGPKFTADDLGGAKRWDGSRHDDIPVGRKSMIDDRDQRSSNNFSSYDDVPVGRRGAASDDRRDRDLDRGRTGAQSRSSPYDDMPVGRKGAANDSDRGRLVDKDRSPRQSAALDGKDHRGGTPRDRDFSRNSSFDDAPIGRRDQQSALPHRVDFDNRRHGVDDYSSRRSALRHGVDEDSFDRRDRGDDLPSRRRRDLNDGALEQQRDREQQKRRPARLRQPLPANLSGTRYEAVHYAAKKVGFLPTADEDFRTPFLIWIDSFISLERLGDLRPFQRVNHFPGMAEITRKDLLAKNLAKAAAVLPQEYNFAPRTWIMPEELASFQQRCKELQKSDKLRSFISKPIDGAMGQGIVVYKTAEAVPQTETAEAASILQEYVSNPFLLDGLKFDLRLFVLITSCDPLRVYFYNDGLLRLSCEPYVDPLKTKSNSVLMHVTSAQLQLQAAAAAAAAEDERERRTTRRSAGRGAADNIRPLRFLNEYLAKRNYDVARMWHSIVELLIRTVFLAQPHLLKSYRRCRQSDQPGSRSVCFELLGFDILLDQNLRPWLMEVNRSPGLDVDHPVEREMKLGLLEETLTLLNCRPSDLKRAEAPPAASKDAAMADHARLQARLRQQAAFKDVETRVCQGFRRIFPVDDAERQAKLTAGLLAVLPAVLDAGSARLQKEMEAFYSNKLSLEEVSKQLATAAGNERISDSSDSDSDASRRRSKKSSIADKELRKEAKEGAAKDGEGGIAGSPADAVDEARASLALKCLNELRIRFPGKSDQEADRLLGALCSAWQTNRPQVGSYWRLSLDSEKRAKVLDIAKRCVRVALEKAFRNGGGSVDLETCRLSRLLERLFNRLLWRNGHGLWDAFNRRPADWEAVIGRHQPTETELLCCRRVVQLCQDCLLTVYLYSEVARPHRESLKRPSALDAALVA